MGNLIMVAALGEHLLNGAAQLFIGGKKYQMNDGNLLLLQN